MTVFDDDGDLLDPRFQRLAFPIYIPRRQGFFEVSPPPKPWWEGLVPVSIILEENDRRDEMLRRVRDGTCDTAYFVDAGKQILERSEWKSFGRREALARWDDDGGRSGSER